MIILYSVIDLSIVSSLPFWTFFPVILQMRDSTEAENMAILVFSDVKSTRNIFFSTQTFILTFIFAILVGHIALKNLTENSGLQSHTMPWAEGQTMSIWREKSKSWRHESAAIWIMKIAVITSRNGLLLKCSYIKLLKMYKKVSHVVLSCVVEQTQNYRFYRFLFRCFT